MRRRRTLCFLIVFVRFDIEGCVIGRAIESKGRGMDMELYHSFCFTATTTLMKGGLLVVIY
jgi:hypothetical protein